MICMMVANQKAENVGEYEMTGVFLKSIGLSMSTLLQTFITSSFGSLCIFEDVQLIDIICYNRDAFMLS